MAVENVYRTLNLNLDLNLDLNLNLDSDFFKPTTTLIFTLIPTTMALTEKEWATIVNKYGYGINLGETTKDKLAEFVKTKIYMYEKEDFLNNTLWTVF